MSDLCDKDLDDGIVVEHIERDSLLLVALACTRLCDAVRGILGGRLKGRLKTSAACVASSVERIQWILSWPIDQQPPWLCAWDCGTSQVVACLLYTSPSPRD